MANATQFANAAGHNRPCDLVIGLDFGTSCTKVVIRSPLVRDRTFAVPFGPAAHPSCQYLLPSALWIDRNTGRASLTTIPDGRRLVDIKRPLMGWTVGQSDDPPAAKNAAVAVATAYLALVLRSVRQWFLRTQQDGYGGFFLFWQVNLGLPSADFADLQLCRRYLSIIATAWQLSIRGGAIHLRDAAAEYEQTDAEEAEMQNDFGIFIGSDESSSAQVNLIPEVAAEAAGYAKSHQRDEGLHVLMDIGAGTLDICGFVLHERDGEDRYELLTADVQRLGVMELNDRRQAVMERANCAKRSGEPRSEWDPIEPFQISRKRYLPPNLNENGRELLRQLRRCDKDYFHQCSKMLDLTLGDLRLHRDPNSPRWRDELPLFLAGGGAALARYARMIEKVSNKWSTFYSHQGFRGISRLAIAKPDRLEGAEIDDTVFRRLAVAWGLSYQSVDIGNVSRPEETEDVPARESESYEAVYVDKSMV